MNRLEVEEINLNELTSAVEMSINTPDNLTETGELKDNIVLDLSNQLKEKFNKLHDLEMKFIKKKKKEVKVLLKIYGIIMSIEKLITETIEVPHELQTLIDISADMMEDFINEEFFPNLHRIDD